MARGKAIDEVLADGEQIIRVWTDNPTFTLGEITLPLLQSTVDELRTLRGQIEDKRMELTKLLNDSDVKAADIMSAITRARSGFRASFGPDSTQYEQAGGTRSSERKRPGARKPKTT